RSGGVLSRGGPRPARGRRGGFVASTCLYGSQLFDEREVRGHVPDATVEEEGQARAAANGKRPFPASSPCIDPIFGPTPAIDHWSATTVATIPSSAWLVEFFAPGFA